MEECHLWLSRFDNQTAVDSFFQEPDAYEDGEPISQFAASQNQPFYDHDFVFAEYSAKGDLSALCDLIGAPVATREAILEAASNQEFNTLIAADKAEIRIPVSCSEDSLLYLGCFELWT